MNKHSSGGKGTEEAASISAMLAAAPIPLSAPSVVPSALILPMFGWRGAVVSAQLVCAAQSGPFECSRFSPSVSASCVRCENSLSDPGPDLVFQKKSLLTDGAGEDERARERGNVSVFVRVTKSADRLGRGRVMGVSK